MAKTRQKITLTFQPGTRSALKKIAAEKGVSVSALMREITKNVCTQK